MGSGLCGEASVDGEERVVHDGMLVRFTMNSILNDCPSFTHVRESQLRMWSQVRECVSLPSWAALGPSALERAASNSFSA